ncbi:hypothetical protein EN814_16380 [Mesorhizobium sp. M2D.F.Ca.ET.171.01.1.1]|uniref:DUF6074 family protein n=1 Tax=unclassified Mesorhizobium TaxID=325217 RepID=UPI001092F634|nr:MULTISPECIES: DUF6074 family protein [unclassified Mesorhizobium]TGS95277.1 hypothetical protein EN821_16395 [Mesorhizobium sp. M2D.F.Ca.ET.178.01.1.1]TGT10816.1 hypothetical protein EN814_16380 [Mesorhizobium sp. M2D.F.Ca.ET.171.01.1.1]
MTHTEHCQVIAFPLIQRTGKIRDVATKMLAKTTDRHAESYRDQVTAALVSQFDRLGVVEHERDRQVTQFWAAVQTEIIRQSYRQQA